jgi:phosphoglycolate phosphatase
MMNDSVKTYGHIIWDWNGTLLDDVDIVIEAMNTLLKRRNLPLLGKEKYKKIFTFPVKDYYAQLGFNFSIEPFEKLAIEYMTELNSDKYQFKLYSGVEKILECVRRMGISQSILSASQEQELIDEVGKLNIGGYFKRISGLNNYYAISKVERGEDLLRELAIKPDDALLIGDTIHDYEVAEELGCGCLLICNGHQCCQRLSLCNASIVEDISDVIGFIKGEAIA